MAHQIKSACPACGAPMHITRYRCTQCGTEVAGTFQTCPFCHLDGDLHDFMIVFITKRGNIKLVERALGISYPTVRKQLKRLIEALGYSDEEEVRILSRTEKLRILDRLEKGEIDYEEAMRLLDGMDEMREE